MSHRGCRLLFALAVGCAQFALRAAAQQPREETVPLVGGIELQMLRVEPGSFRQGSPETEAGRPAEETPREVTLTRAFYLGKFPVTRGQFARFIAESHYRTEAEVGTSGGFGWDGAKLTQRKEFSWRNPGFAQTDEHPVVLVTFNDAKAFTTWLARRTGGSFELPTEAQWEYAARAGTTTAWPSGEDPAAADALAWHKGNSGMATHPVGEKALNPWGFADMNGHVWEWCQDWFAPYEPGPQTDPLQRNRSLSDKPRRVLRGGSWLREVSATRSAARYRNDPQSRNADNGFRVMAFELRGAAPAPRPAAVPPEIPLERADGNPAPIPAAPPHDFEEPREEPQRARTTPTDVRNWTGILGLACVGSVVLIVFVVIFFRRLISGGGSAPSISVPSLGGLTRRSSGPLRTRIAEDGFWIDSEAPIGAHVICRYTTNGEPQQTEVPIESASQFVYTGARPASISVVVVPGSGSSSMLPDAGPTIMPGSILDDDGARERRRRSRTPPPAY